MMRRRLWEGLVLVVGMWGAGMAYAQNAAAPLTLVVPYPAGGPLDKSARILAESASAQLGVIRVENKPGAGGNLGAELVAKAPADANLLVMGAVATHAVNPWLYKNFPYDPIRDFKPIALVARTPNVLVMSADRAQALGIATTTDLVKYLKAHPDQVRYGSGGNGSIGHIAAEMFKSLTNTRMGHQPFAGAGPALKALQEGGVALVFDNLASSLPLIQAGKLKALPTAWAAASSTTNPPTPPCPASPASTARCPASTSRPGSACSPRRRCLTQPRRNMPTRFPPPCARLQARRSSRRWAWSPRSWCSARAPARSWPKSRRRSPRSASSSPSSRRTRPARAAA